MPGKVVRFTIGCAAGLVVWWYGTPLYAAVVAPIARALVRLSSLFAAAQFAASGMNMNISGESLPAAHIPFSQLTYNLILFLGLFATVRGVLRGRNLVRLVVATVVLFLTHVLATAADVMSTYATRLGPWSNAHFSPFEQDLWTAVDYVYRIGGMFAIAFVCWYLAAEAPAPQKRQRRPRA